MLELWSAGRNRIAEHGGGDGGDSLRGGAAEDNAKAQRSLTKIGFRGIFSKNGGGSKSE